MKAASSEGSVTANGRGPIMGLDGDQALRLALTLPETEAAPHMDRTAVRVRKGRIFATLAADRLSMNVKLTPDEQALYVEAIGGALAPVANAWGRQGWTTMTLGLIDETTATAVLTTAWRGAAPSKVRTMKSPGG